LHEPDRLRKMQSNLADCARRTLFAMGENAHRYNDAFAQVIRMLDYYLKGLGERRSAEKNLHKNKQQHAKSNT
jgi:hypothetical protein